MPRSAVPPFVRAEPATLLRIPGVRDGSLLRRIAILHPLGAPGRTVGGSGVTMVPYLLLCLEGQLAVLHWQGGRIARLVRGPGEAALCAPGTWVGVRGRYRLLRITFDEQAALVAIRPWAGELVGLVLDSGPGALASALARALLAGAADDADGAGLAFGRALLAEIARRVAEPQSASPARALWLEMRSWLVERLPEPVTRAQLARRFGVHPGYVSRLFARCASASLPDVQHRIRLERAAAMLREQDLGVAAIAAACGYGSAAHFIRSFHRHYDLTPSRFRREARRAASCPPAILAQAEKESPIGVPTKI